MADRCGTTYDVYVGFKRSNSYELIRELIGDRQYDMTLTSDYVVIHAREEEEGCTLVEILKSFDKKFSDVHMMIDRSKAKSDTEKDVSEKLWNENLNKAEELLKNHEGKIAAAKELYEDVKKHINDEPTNFVNIESKLKLLESHKRSIEELMDQKKEFQTFLGQAEQQFINIKMDSLEDNKPFLHHLKTLDIEMERLRAALPIYSKKSHIVQMIRENQVTILTAETGSGKSTQVVQYLYQDGFGEEGLIVCTQPRKVAALSLARRVAQELQCTVGQAVGFIVGMQLQRSTDTSILFMTDQVLLNECIRDPLFKNYKCIVIDEAHERSISTDLLLAMVKKALLKRPDLRVVISSATIDPTIFYKYFEGMVAKLHVYGRTFPVEIYWETESRQTNYLEAAVAKAKEIHACKPDGDILVFLTTPLETEKAQEFINADSQLKQVHCLVLHGRLQSEEQCMIFNPAPPGKRKVVFATNSAETSVTIPNIRYVIDNGMVKEKFYDMKRNLSTLKIGPISKSSAKQRMGRAGRTQEGECYRLYTKEEYDLMTEIMCPEILRENLGTALLKLLQLGIKDPLTYDFVEMPPEESLNMALVELMNLEAVENGILTAHGKIMASLPVEPRLGKFVTLGMEAGLTMDSVVVAAICSVGGNVFFRAGTNEEKQVADRLKVRFCSRYGDLMTLLDVYKEWDKLDDRLKNQWCKSNSMNAKSLRYARDLVKDMKFSLERIDGSRIPDHYDSDNRISDFLPQLMLRCFERNVAYFSGHERGGYFRLNGERSFLHPSSALSFLSMTPRWVLFEETLETNRPYLLNVSALPEDTQSNIVTYNKDIVVKRVHSVVIGKEIASSLQFGRNDGKFEVSATQALDTNIFADYDENTGKADIYALDSAAKDATAFFQEAIEKEISRFQQKVLELPISEGNSYSQVIGSGGETLDILYPDEFLSVLIQPPPDMASLPEQAMEDIFSPFGCISEMKKFRSSTSYWGKITYTNRVSAEKAVENNRPSENEDGSFVVKPDVMGKLNENLIGQDFRLDITWTRRKGKGFGFLSFEDPNSGNELVMQERPLVGSQYYTFQRSKKNPNDVRISGLDVCLSSEQLTSAIEGQFPHIKVTKCVIPRENKEMESKEAIRSMQRQLTMEINKTLNSTNDDNKNMFNVRIFPVRNPKDYDYRGMISFRNVTQGYAVINNNIMVNNAMVKFTPSLNFTSRVNRDQYVIVEEDIANLKRIAASVNITINEKRIRQRTFYDIGIKGENVEKVFDARLSLQKILKGVSITCSDREFRYFLTPMGKNFISDIRQEEQCILILDYRNKSITVHAAPAVRERICEKIVLKKTSIECNEEEKVIYLNKDNVPRGFIKHLIKKYGSDLDRLYEQSKAHYVYINFFRHTLHLYGNPESLQICQDMVNELKMEYNGRDDNDQSTNQIICPICFDDIPTNGYVLQSCSHIYCKECIQGMCNHAVTNNNLPLVCASDGCNVSVSITDLNEFVESRKLAQPSLGQFVAKNNGVFAHCITPNCGMIYRKSEEKDPGPFQCPICFVYICTFCQIEYHSNVTCAINSRGDDESLKIWLSDKSKDRGICPKCSTPIERSDGCLHMTCSVCKQHVCWRCKRAYFDTANDCYVHLYTCTV